MTAGAVAPHPVAGEELLRADRGCLSDSGAVSETRVDELDRNPNMVLVGGAHGVRALKLAYVRHAVLHHLPVPDRVHVPGRCVALELRQQRVKVRADHALKAPSRQRRSTGFDWDFYGPDSVQYPLFDGGNYPTAQTVTTILH